MRKLLIIIILLFSAGIADAQEFICSISVSSPQVQGTDRTVYSEMQKALYEFVNQKKWSGYNFRQEEKIECTLAITISDRISTDEFKGTMNIQLRRPVYRTSYNSPVINYIDKNIQFRYLEGQNLEFSDNTFSSNLTSLIAFYVYIFLGMDFDTYSLYGGTSFFQKAQSVVTSAQSTPEYGWKAFESLKNRYWLAENLLNSTYAPLREAMYKYHRLGLDGMNDNMDIGRASVMDAIELVKKVNREKPNLFLVQLIMEAKGDELVNIFSQASPMDKTKAVNTLKEIDPANSSKYQKILTTN
jgi:hypothetical protein